MVLKLLLKVSYNGHLNKAEIIETFKEWTSILLVLMNSMTGIYIPRYNGST